MRSVRGKWVLITGATSGIGNAIAKLFASAGANLIITGRRDERLEALSNVLREKYEVHVKSYCYDIRQMDKSVYMANDLFEQGIVPDILINNAGLAAGKAPIQEGLIGDWERMIDTNIKGLLYVTRSILPRMIERDSGMIINIGSTAGHVVYPEGNVYNATKFAVRALTDAINLDLKGTRIRVSSIDPGACETEFSLVRFGGDTSRAAKVYEGYRALKPEDIADIALYVASSPEHVNITNVLVYPTDQRNVYVWHKELPS